jgi:hypothetical protein
MLKRFMIIGLCLFYTRALFASSLVLTEVHYNPPVWPSSYPSEEYEFVEFYNSGTNAISLMKAGMGGAVTSFWFKTSAVTNLGPGEYVVVVKNFAVFSAWYNNTWGGTIKIAGQWPGGKLGDKGETILWTDETNGIHSLTYQDGGDWPTRADGGGASIELIDLAGDPNLAENWRASRRLGGTPGRDREMPPYTVVMNEILTHTDVPDYDFMELYNASTQEVDIGGWYLSDSATNLFRYRIPFGTVMDQDGYVVYLSNEAPGGVLPFNLDGAHGEEIWLVSSNSSKGWIMDFVAFGGASNGVSFGRWPNGTGDEMYPMLTKTMGGPNSGPRFGPLVISEINYSPGTTNLPDDLEFVELYNSSNMPMTLTDWRFGDGIDYAFATGTVINAGQIMVLLPFDPLVATNQDRLDRFVTTYNVPEDTMLLGPFTGRLSNAGEDLTLENHDEPPIEEPTFLPHFIHDKVPYSDSKPWPWKADGYGFSVQRRSPALFGGDGSNWWAEVPTPGVVDFDWDGDGMPDQWEMAYFGGTNAADGGATNDYDHDGMPNMGEFLTGTNPTNQYSKLMITAMDSPPSATSRVVMAWSSVTNIFYAVSVRPSFTGDWQVLQKRLPATPPENVSTVDVSAAGSVTGLFLRVTGD